MSSCLPITAGRRSVSTDPKLAVRTPRPSKRCNICDGGTFETISDKDRHGDRLLTDLCTSCGLVMHHEVPSEEEVAEFYATEYRVAYHGETTPSVRRVMRAWKNGERLFRLLRPFLGEAREILEIGAGVGCTVKVFERNGYSAAGIEPNKGFQRFAERQLRAPVSNSSLRELPQVPRYDLVLLVHVIEHLRSPRESLQHIRGMLNPNGRLYVECPNLGAPFATIDKLFHYAHIHNFTRSTMGLLAERCGFAIDRWLSDEHDPNLSVLLRRQDSKSESVQLPGCSSTLRALRRYNAWTYHLRSRYLWSRFFKMASYGWEYLTANWFVKNLIKRVAQDESMDAVGRRRERA